MKTFKVEYITTLFFLTLLIALAWYYLFLMASNPMDSMMQNKNPMTMSMDIDRTDSSHRLCPL